MRAFEHPSGLIQVVGAAILRRDRCLVAQRGESMSLPFAWEFPGGKVESGEERRDALVREIREELGLHIEVDRSLGVAVLPPVELEVFAARVVGGTLAAVEHREVRWATWQEMRQLRFAPADVPLLANVETAMRRERR